MTHQGPRTQVVPVQLQCSSKVHHSLHMQNTVSEPASPPDTLEAHLLLAHMQSSVSQQITAYQTCSDKDNLLEFECSIALNLRV